MNAAAVFEINTDRRSLTCSPLADKAARAYAAASMPGRDTAASGRERSQARTDAQLTGVAHDLLAALKELCSLSLMPIQPWQQARFDRAAVLATFAINKAEGRS